MAYDSGYTISREIHWKSELHAPCEECKSRRWVWTHHSGDGHGGLNGGAWDNLPCHICNPNTRYPYRPDLGYYSRMTEQLFPEEGDMEAGTVTPEPFVPTIEKKAGRYIVLKKVADDSFLVVDTVTAPNSKAAVRQVAIQKDGSLIEGTYVGVPLSSFKEFTPKVKTNITWE